MLQPGRKYSSANGYRYGFNGKENDKDVAGDGNQYDYGFRIYNPRIGKFLSVDPLSKSYPWNSTYAYAENDVIRNIDLDGEEKKHYLLDWDEKHEKANLKYTHSTDFIQTTTKWTPTWTNWTKSTTTSVKNPRVDYVVHGAVSVPYGGEGMFSDQIQQVTWTFKTAEKMFSRLKEHNDFMNMHLEDRRSSWHCPSAWLYYDCDQLWEIQKTQMFTYGIEAQATKSIYSPNVFRGNLKGQKVNIYGEGEEIGFKDYATEAKFKVGTNGVERPLTSTIKNGAASSIAINSAPLSQTTLNEITRISRSGTIVSYTTGAGSATLKTLADHLGKSATQISSVNFTATYQGHSSTMTTVTYIIK